MYMVHHKLVYFSAKSASHVTCVFYAMCLHCFKFTICMMP